MKQFNINAKFYNPVSFKDLKDKITKKTKLILVENPGSNTFVFKKNLVIKTGSDLTVEEMREIVKSSIENAKDDMDTRLLIESKIKASRLLNEIENVKDQIESLCSKKDIENINKTSNMLKKELKTNNKDSIEDLVENLNEKTKNFAQKLIDKNFENFVGKDLDVLE